MLPIIHPEQLENQSKIANNSFISSEQIETTKLREKLNYLSRVALSPIYYLVVDVFDSYLVAEMFANRLHGFAKVAKNTMGGLNISPRDVQGLVSEETVVPLRCGDEKRSFGLKQVWVKASVRLSS